MRVIDPLHCYMNVTTHRPAVYYKGEALTGFDAVIPRIGASITFYGTAVLRQFEMMDVYPVNESVAITRARDKLRSLQLLARKGIGLPVTGLAHSPDDIKHVISMVGGAPLVIKLIEGTQGIGVVLAETSQAAESVIDAFLGLKANILVQEYIGEARGSDIRCLVVGDKVVAAMERRAREGDFRSNLHRGGTGTAAKLTPEEYSGARGAHDQRTWRRRYSAFQSRSVVLEVVIAGLEGSGRLPGGHCQYDDRIRRKERTRQQHAHPWQG